MNKEGYALVKKDLEKHFLKGWEDIYGTLFSKNGFIDKDQWEDFWKERLQQEGLHKSKKVK